MKTKAFLLTLMITLVLYSLALAQSSNPVAPEPLVLTDQQGKYLLGMYMQVLVDPSGELTIDKVSSPEFDSRFIPSQTQSPNYGYTTSTYWVRFNLRNESQRNESWLLEVNFANMEYVDLYLPLPGGNGFITKQTGVLRPFNTRDIAYNRIVFNLPLNYSEELTIYIRFQTSSSMTLPMTLWSPDVFLRASGTELLFLGMFYGVFLIMLLYNLFLLYSLREASYLYFVFFLASGLLLFTTYDGVADEYLWPGLPAINHFAIPLLFILFMASMIKFTDNFLETGTRNPKLHRLLLVLLAGWGIALLLVPLVSNHFIRILIVPLGVLSFGMIGLAGIVSWRSGYKPARYFLLSWIGLIFGGMIVLLVRLELVPSTAFTEQLYRPGIIWLVAFWSVALADRINLLKAEKETANLEILASETRYRQLIETMNDGLGVIDKDGRYTYVNLRLVEMFGYLPDEIVGHEMTEFAREEDKQILAHQLAKRRTGVNDPYEITWRTKAGLDLVTTVSPRSLFAADGQFLGSIGVVTDITERVQASRLLEQRVNERTRELSTLLEISFEIASTQALDDILCHILERLKSIVDYHHSAILIIEEAYWSIQASWPANLNQVSELHLSTEERRILSQAFKPGEPVFLNHPPDNGLPTNIYQPLSIQLSQVFSDEECSWLGIPLFRTDRLLGLFLLGCEDKVDLSGGQVQVAAAFANQATIVIENRQLLDQIQAGAVAEERNRLARDLHDFCHPGTLLSQHGGRSIAANLAARSPKGA